MDNTSFIRLLPLVEMILVFTFVWLLPAISILRSKKTTGDEELAWVLAVIFISWFAVIFHLLVAPVKKTKK
jgi:membrane protein YdbS with pleckstrin-like domain